MSELTKRATIYFDPEIHRAMKVKSALTNISVSEYIDKAIRRELTEEMEDLRAFEERAGEPSFSFEQVLLDLKANGKLEDRDQKIRRQSARPTSC